MSDIGIQTGNGHQVCWMSEGQKHRALLFGSTGIAADLASRLPRGRVVRKHDRTGVDTLIGLGPEALPFDKIEGIQAIQTVVLTNVHSYERERAVQHWAASPHVRLVTLPSLRTISIAEHTMTLILAAYRGIIEAHQSVVRGDRMPGLMSQLTSVEIYSERWTGSAAPRPVWGKTLGILGMGRVGTEVARRAQAFGIRCIYTDPYPRTDLELTIGIERVRFDQLLRESDIVSIHVPLLDETTRMIDAPEFALMKSDALIVNTSHGRIIDEGSLIMALQHEEIGGAALDALAYEPPAYDSPLLTLPNVLLTPRIATATWDQNRAYIVQQLARILNPDS